KLECRTKQIQLPFDTLPTRDEWTRKAQDKGANAAYHAKKNLARLDRGEKLPTRLPYLVQVWNFGDQLAMIFLPGEVVVHYSLRAVTGRSSKLKAQNKSQGPSPKFQTRGVVGPLELGTLDLELPLSFEL